MINRKTTAFVSAVIMILLISALPLTAGYITKDVNDERVKVGFALNYQDNNMSFYADGVKEFFKDQGNVELIILNADHDPAAQYYNVEYLIAEKVNAVVTVTTDKDSSEITSVLCRKAGIAVNAAEYTASEYSEEEAYFTGYKAAEDALNLILKK